MAHPAKTVGWPANGTPPLAILRRCRRRTERDARRRTAARFATALSRQIRDLEDELGVALFDHGAKAVRLTEAGRVFLTEARAVVQRADEAVQTVKAVASGRRGEIHVGYAPSLTVELLPRALRFFQEANPGVRVQLHDLSTQEMLRGLRDGKLHVALLIQLSARVLAGLVFEELHRYAVCVAVHPAHPLARVRKVGLERDGRGLALQFETNQFSKGDVSKLETVNVSLTEKVRAASWVKSASRLSSEMSAARRYEASVGGGAARNGVSVVTTLRTGDGT